ncbi:MAG: glutamate 5-kinase [Rhodocyclales bacterium]|nr:glutamate 5-kinase [Rhodocyclales bacterium]
MTNPERRAALAAAKLLVVKVGSALVTADGRGLDHEAIRGWAAQIARLFEEGRRVCLVSSGAIAAGMQRLGWHKRPKEIPLLQAAAAVGQAALVDAYEHAFRPHRRHTAQVLLTHADLADRTRYLNARSTLKTLLDLGVVPIINENDTIVTDEIKFGDNDTLGALVTNLIDADALFILTDQQGLYTADPRLHPEATLVREGNAEDPRYAAMAGGAGSSIAKGGMITKIRAAARAAKSGAHTVIASGREPEVIVRLARGEALGTLLYAERNRLAARKQWLADHLKLAGTLHVDAGAARALRQGKSLLPVGVTRVEGEFVRGAVVACLDPQGREIGRGLINYSAAEARAIVGLPSSQIAERLGYMDEPELIHRDNFVLTA